MTTAGRTLSILSAVVVIAVVALTLGTRLLGPHDLYEKDQPKTMAYTADIVLNGRYSLPRDVIYQPATKPPMYNWIDAVFVKLTGRWDEPVLKIPSLLGALATGAIVYAMGIRASQRPARLSDQATSDTRFDYAVWSGAVVGALASAIWFTFGSDVRHASVIRLAYLARPDMLQCAFLTGAWACATVAVLRPNPRTALGPALGFWLCVTAAALTKGPAAAMPVVYAVLFALLTPHERGRSRNLLKLWPAVGVPVLIACVGGWLLLAYRQDPQHVKSVILGAEVAGRIVDRSPEGFAKPHYDELMWFVTKTLPWGGVAVVGLWVAAINARFRQAVLPAALYLVVVLACLSLPAGQRMDYLLPAYPPAAVIIAMLARNFVGATPASPVERHSPPRAMQASPLRKTFAALCLFVPVLLAVQMSHRFLKHFHESVEHYSDNAVAFTRAVRARIGPQTALVLVRGKHPLTTLLGQHPGSFLTRDDLAHVQAVIAPLQPDWPPPLITSAPLPIGFETLENRALAPLGLYVFPPGKIPLDRLIELQKQVATWTPDENPYHAAGTVYRD